MLILRQTSSVHWCLRPNVRTRDAGATALANPILVNVPPIKFLVAFEEYDTRLLFPAPFGPMRTLSLPNSSSTSCRDLKPLMVSLSIGRFSSTALCLTLTTARFESQFYHIPHPNEAAAGIPHHPNSHRTPADTRPAQLTAGRPQTPIARKSHARPRPHQTLHARQRAPSTRRRP